MINIYTGKTGSGKTTRLDNRIHDKKSICGILMPVIDNKRHLFSISSKKLIPLEVDENEPEEGVVRIGKFRFLQKVFNWANSELIKLINSDCKMIVIDEVGPLELNKSGFFPALKAILDDGKKDVLIVVREGLVEEVKSFFRIKEYKVIRDIDNLNNF